MAWKTSGKYVENEWNSGVYIGDENISDINLLEFNMLLNGNNSCFTHSLTNSKNHMTTKEGGIAADADFPVSLYSHDEYDATMYKIPLKLLIDRYLPKSILLGQWYLLKDKTDLNYVNDEQTQSGQNQSQSDDAKLFAVDELIKDIKNIYNYYCWEYSGEVIGDEEVGALTYNEFGAIIRDESGDAVTEKVTKPIAETNKETFIHFGVAGLETNRFGVFSAYIPGKNAIKGPINLQGKTDLEKATVPIVTNLISNTGFFLDEFEVEVEYNYDYAYEYTILEEGWETKRKVGVYPSSIPITDPWYKIDFEATYRKFKNAGPEKIAFIFDTQKYEKYVAAGGNRNTNLKNVSKTLIVSMEKTASGAYSFTYKSKGQPVRETKYDTGNATTITTIKYNRNGQYDTSGLDELSKLLSYGIGAGHQLMQEGATPSTNSLLSPTYSQENPEYEMINNMYYPDTYVYPNEKGDTMYAGAQDMLMVGGYEHDIPVYYFGKEDDPNASDYQNKLCDYQREGIYQTFSGDASPYAEEFKNAVITHITSGEAPDNSSFGPYTLITGPNVPPDTPPMPTEGNVVEGPTYGGITAINWVKITSPDAVKIAFADSYNSAFEHDIAVHIVKEEIIALTIDIPQQRMPALLVKDAQTWAKELSYKIDITQNIFDPTNYRYVVPHAFAGFGLREFNLDEKAHYRVDYYKDYFSQYENAEPRIKEADILEMMIEWEKLGMNGEESAYVMMRDLYKLIMYTRDAGYILGQNYSYLYVPETIWNFREGITQEAFWTERLATRGDPLTAEEQKKIIVKKNEIAWQVVDYANYPECNRKVDSEGETVTALYALFPQGSTYLRTIYQEKAVRTGKFYDGNFKEGHGGADWSSRGEMKKMLKGGGGGEDGDLYGEIYEYDLLCRTLREILNSSTGSESKMAELQNALDPNSLSVNGSHYGNAYSKAKADLDAELGELTSKSPIVSIAPGYVSASRYNCYGGFSVHVIHSSGDKMVKTTYAHMKRWPEVQEGDYVGAGTILGYEGTTGNSGGYHLHMGVNINGESESPAKYMGPIYTPFYNAEKVFEEQENYKAFRNALGDKVLLGSEYLSLIRTVLMARFDGNKLKTGAISEIDPDAIFLSQSHIVTTNGVKYLEFSKYASSNDGESISDAIGTADGKTIINSGDAREPDYWKVQLQEEVISVTGNASQEIDPATGEVIGNSSGKMVKYRIVSAEKIDNISEALNGSVSVKVARQPDRYESTQIIWGSDTVPIYPLFEDYSEAIDVGILTIPKKFEVNKAEYEDFDTPGAVKEYDGPDVRATKDAFDATSEYAQDHTYLDPDDPDNIDLAIYLSDVDNDACIPLYDGPVSKEIYEAYTNGQNPDYLHSAYGSQMVLGLPGTQFYDLEHMQELFVSFGLVPEGKELTIGVFDDVMVETIKSLVAENGLLKNQGQAHPAADNGWLGGVPNSLNFTAYGNAKWFDVTTTTAWDMEMVYHSEKLAKNAGKRSEEIGATRNSLPTPLMRGIGNCESFDIPLMESYAFVVGAENNNFVTEIGKKNYIIHYNLPAGKYRAVRRAQGLCAWSWGSAVGRLGARGITDKYELLLKLRTGIFNAIYAGEYVHDNMSRIVANEERKGLEKAIAFDANANSEVGLLDWAKSVAQSEDWQDLGRDMGVNPTQLVIWSASVCMYRGGPNVIVNANWRQAGQRVAWGFENMEYDRDGTDRYGRAGSIDLHEDQTGYTGTVLKVMYNFYMREREAATGKPWREFSKGGNRLGNGEIAPYGYKPGEECEGSDGKTYIVLTSAEWLAGGGKNTYNGNEDTSDDGVGGRPEDEPEIGTGDPVNGNVTLISNDTIINNGNLND